MPIITGDGSEFGRLVVEEFQRRAQRVIALGQGSGDTDQEPGSGHQDPAGGEDDDEAEDHTS